MSSLQNKLADCAKAVSKLADDCVTLRREILHFRSKAQLIDDFASTSVNGDWSSIRYKVNDILQTLDTNCTALSIHITSYLYLLPNAAEPDCAEDTQAELAALMNALRSTFNNSDKAGEFENIIANVDEVLQTASEAVLNATKELEAEREEVSETLKTAQADENPDRAGNRTLAEVQSRKLEVEEKVAEVKALDWPGCASTLGQIKIALGNIVKGQASLWQSYVIFNEELTGYKKALDDVIASNVQDNKRALEIWHHKARGNEKSFVHLVQSLDYASYKLRE